MATSGREPDLIEQLRQAVRESGLSLNEIARRSGVDQGQLSRFMRGERTIEMPTAARMCAALGLRLTKNKLAEAEEPSSSSEPRPPGSAAGEKTARRGGRRRK
jgi:transcriptional regulator with XRE-family HTH domain